MNEYQKGRYDRRTGLYSGDNPHEKGTNEWQQWQAGYEDEEFEECLDSKCNMSLDDVLDSYAIAAPEFNANILQAFVNEYPEYSNELCRYSYIQLISVPATTEEIEQEGVN